MHRLITMRSAEKSEVWLFSNYLNWNCHFKATVNGTEVSIKKEAETPQQAVDLVYTEFVRITGLMPELLGALPPPEGQSPTDYQDADHMVRPSKPAFDDDIPF